MDNLNFSSLDRTSDEQNPLITSSMSNSTGNNFRHQLFTIQINKINNIQKRDKTSIKLVLSSFDQVLSFQITLQELQNYISTLITLKYSFIPEFYINSISDGLLKEKIESLLNYISTRYDILANEISKIFFHFEELQNIQKLTSVISQQSIELLYLFNMNEDQDPYDMHKLFECSDFTYEPKTGLLCLSYQDKSILASLGKFWNLINSEPIGGLVIYQRVFDKKMNPYFTKKVYKTFDIKTSCISIDSINGIIYVGFCNGTVCTFNITYYDTNDDDFKLTCIGEGEKFKIFNDKIACIEFYNNYTFICGVENKIDVLKSGSLNDPNAKPSPVYSASLQKRMSGKGEITKIIISKSKSKMFVASNSIYILIYNITLSEDGTKISLVFDSVIEVQSNIKNIYYSKENELFVTLKEKVVLVEEDKRRVFDFSGDGEVKSLSSPYLSIKGSQCILSSVYFKELNILILGLNTGTLMSISTITLDIITSKKITENSIIQLVLLPETFVLIVCDICGNVFFLQIGK